MATLAEKVDPQRRAFWLKHLHVWHWVSSAVCLVVMLGFAFTGITLNHASQIPAQPRVSTRQGELPAALRLSAAPAAGAPLPAPICDWIAKELGVEVAGRAGEWSDGEVYVPLPRPGGDAWLSIQFSSGKVQYELTERGWISYLNDLHKGRNTGAAWTWFLDLFAAACFVFCLTGLFLLQLHAGGRPTTWPLVGLGLVIPVVLVLLFVH